MSPVREPSDTFGLAERIRADVERLCTPGDRDLGTDRNRAATAYVGERMRAEGLETREIAFEVPEWRAGSASVRAGAQEFALHPGPFSPALEATGPLVLVHTAEELGALDTPDAVLLLAGEIAAEQFTPRDYPFYRNPAHAALLDALEAARPLAVIAATTESAMTGAMSPFPLIEEVRFAVPSAYMTAEQGAELARHAGKQVAVRIDSQVLASTGTQPVGVSRGTGAGRIVISAHVDSKPGTPGAIDNAAGVAVLLAVASLLRDTRLAHTLEFVPFNGEDHVLAPGELAWLAANPDLSDVALVVNIDAPGLPGDPSAYSLYGVGEPVTRLAEEVSRENSAVAEGPQWPASDHMIFAMRGIPSVAITSSDFATASRGYSHTPADVPSILDYELLAQTARFIAGLVTRA